MASPVVTRPGNVPPPLVAPGGLRRRKRSRLAWLAGLGSFLLIALPVVLLAGAGNPPCPQPGTVDTPAGGGPVAAGMYAQPLRLEPARWYRVGATMYGGPSDPTSGDYGSIGTPGQSYLPAHPDSYAELSVLDRNPANGGSFTFADANALSNLPYLTGLRVANNGVQRILYKRDVGYGQGPGQLIANGQPYRLDVWWQLARQLGVSKNPVDIELAPATGTGATLGQLPAATPTSSAAQCPLTTMSGGTLQLVPGQQAHILPDGSAAAPQDAPTAVKLAIAAANRIHSTYYLAQRPEPLNLIHPWYDCSASTDYVLYNAGLGGPGVTTGGPYAGNSTLLESYGQPGPGRWITVYANSGHAWIVIAGLAFDTADFGGPNIPAGTGPRWRQNPLGNLADGLSYVVRHPSEL